MTKIHHGNKSKAPTQRQLRVGEELRHALATVLFRNEVGDPALDALSITVSEVRITPDLRHATAYVAPLGGEHGEEMLALLSKHAGHIRHEVARRVTLRYAPQFRFKLDNSFDYAMKINALMNNPEVARDVHAAADERQEPQ